MITPFRESQFQARDIIEPSGEFILVYVKCCLKEAKRRDPKGLYEQATDGNIENFTGVNHPFQEPHNAEIIVDTEEWTVSQSVNHVLRRLGELGVLEEQTSTDYGFDITPTEVQSIRDRLSDLGYTEPSDDK
jgi:adenylylsulfate kinase